MTRKTPIERLIDSYPAYQQEGMLQLCQSLGSPTTDPVVNCMNTATSEYVLLKLLSPDRDFYLSVLTARAETTSDLSFEMGFLTALKLIEQHLEANPGGVGAAVEYVKSQFHENMNQLSETIDKVNSQIGEL